MPLFNGLMQKNTAVVTLTIEILNISFILCCRQCRISSECRNFFSISLARKLVTSSFCRPKWRICTRILPHQGKIIWPCGLWIPIDKWNKITKKNMLQMWQKDRRTENWTRQGELGEKVIHRDSQQKQSLDKKISKMYMVEYECVHNQMMMFCSEVICTMWPERATMDTLAIRLTFLMSIEENRKTNIFLKGILDIPFCLKYLQNSCGR